MSSAHHPSRRPLLSALRSTWTVATLVLLAGAANNARANINIVFDYTYDTGAFFDITRKSVLESAALVFESRLQDNLTAITPGGANSFSVFFFNPINPSLTDINLPTLSVAANEVRVFVAGGNMGGALGVGGPGGYSASGSAAFLNNAASRGQAGALGAAASQTDFGPWGGSIGFSSTVAWHFDTDPSTKEVFAGSFDFYSVAVHELGHLLGLGTANSWENLSVGTAYNGAAAGAQTVTADKGHWAVGTMSTVGFNAQEASMTPSIGSNVRKYFTTLDYAGMQDLGWQVSPIPEPASWLLWGAGGVLLAGLRRRQGAAV